MRKQLLLKIVNPLLGLAFLSIIFSLPFMLIQDLWSASISGLHRVFGITFVVLALAHIMLNWTWIRNTFFRKNESGRK
jgi:hypothetical protein